MEHTPKNILIRAVKKTLKTTGAKQSGQEITESLQALEEMLHMEPTLGKLVNEMDMKKRENKK